jgi:hypothetical protein
MIVFAEVEGFVEKVRAKAAKREVAERFEAILSKRPGASLVAEKVVRRVVEVYGDRRPTGAELAFRRNLLEDILRAISRISQCGAGSRNLSPEMAIEHQLA